MYICSILCHSANAMLDWSMESNRKPRSICYMTKVALQISKGKRIDESTELEQLKGKKFHTKYQLHTNFTPKAKTYSK